MLVLVVELFVLFIVLVLLIIAGFMVLLYHLYTYTHYALLGGHSDHGTNCGAFSVYITIVAGNTFWAYGAALSSL